MNDVTTHKVINSNSEMKQEIDSWIKTCSIHPEILTRQDIEDRRHHREYDKNVANLNPEDELKRRTDFDENFRRMQSDYRDKNSASMPVVIRTVSRWRIFIFWR